MVGKTPAFERRNVYGTEVAGKRFAPFLRTALRRTHRCWPSRRSD